MPREPWCSDDDLWLTVLRKYDLINTDERNFDTGFGKAYGHDYFIGYDELIYLTANRSMTLRIDLVDFSGLRSLWAEVNDFKALSTAKMTFSSIRDYSCVMPIASKWTLPALIEDRVFKRKTFRNTHWQYNWFTFMVRPQGPISEDLGFKAQQNQHLDYVNLNNAFCISFDYKLTSYSYTYRLYSMMILDVYIHPRYVFRFYEYSFIKNTWYSKELRQPTNVWFKVSVSRYINGDRWYYSGFIDEKLIFGGEMSKSDVKPLVGNLTVKAVIRSKLSENAKAGDL